MIITHCRAKHALSAPNTDVLQPDASDRHPGDDRMDGRDRANAWNASECRPFFCSDSTTVRLQNMRFGLRVVGSKAPAIGINIPLLPHRSSTHPLTHSSLRRDEGKRTSSQTHRVVQRALCPIYALSFDKDQPFSWLVFVQLFECM